MESYIEQSVPGKKSTGKSVLYALCWCAVGLLVIIAMFFGSGVFGDNPDRLEINWLNVVLLICCLLAALGIFRRKDHLRMEYDYILRDGRLEISGIMNARRRRTLGTIHIDRIAQIGKADSADGLKALQNPKLKRHRWFADADAQLYYLIYAEENARHLALLELNDEILTAIRRGGKLARDAWRDEEGKSSNYASLS
ncbi:MAG: hypothetical protein J6J78_05780 [Clostridia bacterium]|nr:hypothetical protein [Clostridia bacterium]